MNETLALKEREIEDLRRGNVVSNQGDKDREIEYWKTKATQNEAEFFNKIQNIKIQTENALREKIVINMKKFNLIFKEGEVKSALQHFEDEKNVLQKRINDLTLENQSLKGSNQPNLENDSSYWREKYNELEAKFDHKIKTAMVS